MIIAKVFPIERADNEAGMAFADWLVRLCRVYDDVIALAIETGVVAAPGALPIEAGKLRRVLPKEMYKPFEVLDIDALSEGPFHNKSIVANPSSCSPAPNPDTKAPLHEVVYTYIEHTPLWEYPHNTSGENISKNNNTNPKKKIRHRNLRGPKIAVEAVAVGPPEFIKRTFPSLAKAGSVEVFQTEIMGVIVRFLWQHVKKYYVRQWREFCLLLFTFVFGIYLDLYCNEQKDYTLKLDLFTALTQDHSKSTYPLLIITSRLFLLTSFTIAVLFLSREFRQMKVHGLFQYFDSGWNRLELTGYFFVTLTSTFDCVAFLYTYMIYYSYFCF